MATIALGIVDTSDYALKILKREGIAVATMLHRHANGDRGNISFIDEDDEEYEPPCPKTESVYLLRSGDAINIITYEYPERVVTAILGIPRDLVRNWTDG